jgi:hypothetical protein
MSIAWWHRFSAPTGAGAAGRSRSAMSVRASLTQGRSARHSLTADTALLLGCPAAVRFASFPHAQAAAGGKQRAPGGRDRGEPGQAGPRHVDVDRLDLAAAEVGLMPKAGAAPVSQELLPPLLVRQGPGPALEGVEVTPVLTHSRMRRVQREQQVLVQQQTVGLRFDRLADLRAERDEGPHAPRLVDPHPQVDHHEVGVGRQVGRRPVQCARHRSTIHAHYAAMQPRP